VDGAAAQVEQRRGGPVEVVLRARDEVGLDGLVQLEDLLGLEEVGGDVGEVVLVEAGDVGVGLCLRGLLRPVRVEDLRLLVGGRMGVVLLESRGQDGLVITNTLERRTRTIT
jgi:hypothetical protein